MTERYTLYHPEKARAGHIFMAGSLGERNDKAAEMIASGWFDNPAKFERGHPLQVRVESGSLDAIERKVPSDGPTLDEQAAAAQAAADKKAFEEGIRTPQTIREEMKERQEELTEKMIDKGFPYENKNPVSSSAKIPEPVDDSEDEPNTPNENSEGNGQSVDDPEKDPTTDL